MTATQYKAAIAKLGLSQTAAAEFLGISLRTSHGYANGKPIPQPIVMLLLVLMQNRMTPEEMEKLATGR